MKNKLILFAAIATLLLLPKTYYSQTITVGSTSNYALFSSNGPVSNTGISGITGDVGTNNGTCSNFSGVIGVVHTMDASTALCATDLLSLYTQLNTTAATLIPVPTLGNGQTITAGAYSITTAATLNATLTFDAQGNSNAVFIIQIQGAFSSNAGAVVNLINGALACNVYWKVEGAINLGAGSLMKGTFIANNAFVGLGSGVVLEGRAMSTAGAVAVDGVTIFIPICANPSPTIITQPVSQTICTGASVSFSVDAIGAGLSYQWRKGLVNLVDGGPISGATTSVLTINPANPADDASDYNVMVNGTYLPGVVSVNVSLLVLTAPVFTSPPTSQTVCAGTLVSFSVTASGTGIVYQWRKGVVNLIDGGTISGANTNVLTLGPLVLSDAAPDYNVVISNACFPNISSPNVSLVINTGPSITTQAVSQTVCAGTSIVFGITASGQALTYQWRKGLINLSNTGNLSGVTSPSLTISAVTAGDAASDYNVVVSGLCLPNIISNATSLVVNQSPVIVTQAPSQTVCAGTGVSFPITATGSGLTYQWRKGLVNLVNGGALSGANSAILSINPVALSDAANNYNCVVSGICSPNQVSSNVTLSVNNSASITSQPISQTVCAGANVNFSVTASGSGLSYQWKKGLINLTNGGNTSGVNTAVLNLNTVGLPDASSNYNVVVTGICLPGVTSIQVALVVNLAPSITTQAVSQTVCAGSAVNFMIVASGSGLTYQWRKGLVTLNNGGTISGATSAQLNISTTSPGDAASNYNVVVTGLCAPSITSSPVSLQVNTSPILVSQPASQTVCAGSPVNFIVIASGSGLSYQWRKGLVNISNGGLVSGATSSVLTISSVALTDNAPDYNVLITGLCSPNVTSLNASLLVHVAPAIVTQPISQTVCVGSSVNFSVLATGTDLSYQWRKGLANINNGNNISGANSAVLNFNPSQLSHVANNYNVVVSGHCLPDQISINVSLVLTTAPVINMISGPQHVCEGANATFTVAVTGTGLTYQWRKGLVNLSNGGSVSGVNTATLQLTSLNTSNAGNYNVVITGLCATSLTTANMTLYVDTAPVIVLQPNNQMGYIGGSVSFSVIATGTDLTYQWRRGTVNLGNATNIFGANTSVLKINPIHAADTAMNYNVVVTGVCSPAVVSNNAILWICICDNPTSLREEILIDEVNIYPNPFFNSINVVLDKESEMNSCEIVLYSMSGIEVLRSTITKESSLIDTSQLSAGAYSYTILSGDKVIKTGKLISQH